ALQLTVRPAQMLAGTLVGLRTPLTHFDASKFKDFVWRAMFAKTLPHADFDTVTRAEYRVACVPWSAAHVVGLVTRRFGRAIYPRLDTDGFDVMITETPYPGRVTGRTKMVVRYHDAIPLLMPHTISDKAHHQASHYEALRRNVADGAWFACVSDATRQDLISIFPEAGPRAVTIHNVVSHHYFPEDSAPVRIPEIIKTRRNASAKGLGNNPIDIGPGVPEYLLMVSTIEPRKNHLTLLAAWEHLRTEFRPGLKLVLVGSLGWDHKAIVRKLRPWMDAGGLYLLEDVPAAELRLLYRHALATACPSYGEGFDFSGVEAMRCGGVVAASDIPVHRDIFGAAAEYFNPYSTNELVQAVRRLIDPGTQGRRTELVDEGARTAARYLPERVSPQWQAFLASLAGAPGTA
ncbi:MAG TPA: glycosyltransferase family 1 protein, partial [Albitalea sp.]|nr:glycosyltransferase family 1 protein [Albitalea sp.]